MASRIAVGLIGYGLAGQAFHAPLIAATPELRLASIVTSDSDRAASARTRYPDSDVVDSVDRLWRTRPDLVVIATTNVSHEPLALEAIARGVAVVVDKPLALSTGQAGGLIAAAQAGSVPLTVFQNRRWDGDFLTVRDLMEFDAFGAVSRFESRFERFRPTPKGGWRERTSPQEGGGILFDLGSHIIDQAVALFGPVLDVYAEVDTTRPDASTDDDVFVALNHANGVRSHLFASATAADLGPRFRVLGTRAGYHVYGLDVQETALRSGAVPGLNWGTYPESTWGVLTDAHTSRAVPTKNGDYPAFYAQLADALQHGSALPVDPADAVTTLRIIEAARRSSTTHTVVPLDAT
jgi:predicted dehydrogenase